MLRRDSVPGEAIVLRIESNDIGKVEHLCHASGEAGFARAKAMQNSWFEFIQFAQQYSSVLQPEEGYFAHWVADESDRRREDRSGGGVCRANYRRKM